MKKFLVALLVVAIIAAVVVGGVFLYKTLSKGDELPVTPESTVDGENQPPPNLTKNTGADILTAIANAQKENPDTIGWLKIPDTNIDNSVLQSHDNDYYLRRTEAGAYDVYGCYFVDYECHTGTRDALSPNTVIYGHSDLKNSLDGFRFSQLFNFTDANFAGETPYIYFSTAEEYMVWQVMAVFYTDTKMDYITINQTPEQLLALVDEGKSKSLYNYNCTFEPTDKLLCLSTCSVKYGGRADERFVVMAKLLPSDAPLTDFADFTVNENPVQPNFG
ncbi:MAG: class B sortase [Oscillospiraceae bacterium]